MKKNYSAADLIVPAVFVLFVFGFAVAGLLLPDKDFSESENRYLQRLPKFSFSALLGSEYGKDFESFVNDQFPARDTFTGAKSQCEYLLGKRDTNGIYFARDGSLVVKYGEADVDVRQLEKNLGYIGDFIVSLRSTAVKAAAMPVPSAQCVFPEKLPHLAPSFNENSAFETLKDRLERDEYVDVYGIFRNHKDEKLYYGTDHHWTTSGAFYAYRGFCETFGLTPYDIADFETETASDSFFGTSYSKAHLISTKPDSIELFTLRKSPVFSVDINAGETISNTLYFRDYLNRRDKYSVFLGGNNPVVTIETDIANGRRLLIVKDSFAHSFVTFAALHYEKTVLLDLRYFNGSVGEYIADNGITDVLVLYGFGTLQSENTVAKLDT